MKNPCINHTFKKMLIKTVFRDIIHIHFAIDLFFFFIYNFIIFLVYTLFICL